MILNFFSYRTSQSSRHEQEQTVKGLGTQLTSETTTTNEILIVRFRHVINFNPFINVDRMEGN